MNNTLNKNLMYGFIGGAMIAVIIALVFSGDSTDPISNGTGPKVTVYKSLSCGCCVNYISYLKKNGYDVTVVSTNDTADIKDKYNIPHNMQSCHTTVMDDVAIEGHVPLDAVTMIREQNPDLEVVALPGMPAGSSGMPGIKRGDFKIFALHDGAVTNSINF
ncbi:MAG: CopG family transcriptional regulator [Parcubacteria group bacterium]|jgi:hypothetical protein|nr:CopG family transcriptional regulator [Parcubacteria group bacterium]|tara:strand:- start:1906 stop:2388 length:483 start_codon:yes stop_codon:yes gene_type:complete